MEDTNPDILPGSTVAVGLSGGLDSLMAAWELAQAGYRVIGLHARFLDGVDCEVRLNALQRACEFIGVPLEVADLRRQFELEVVQPFIAAYAAGLTPNPCALCNPRLKFGLLLEHALRLGADRLATGHYARKGRWRPCAGESGSEYIVIYPAHDQSKDQGYFLALVPPESLRRAVFPLHCKSKPEIRQKARELGIPLPVPKESQEICFVPNDDYRAFLLERKAALPGEGPVCLSNGREIARHRGVWQYTEGQRRGLGIAWSEPLYVLGKDLKRNSLMVGPAGELKSWECMAGQLNFYVPFNLWPEQLLVRLRYRQKALPARVRIVDGKMHISYAEPQAPAAKGQLAAVYHPDGFILGGGIIE
ncbi:MAG: tRNA 2-thiouridine(34) synthase MnmA [Desulfovibrionaceae bacterium]|nr:tRNA 2-thiouridine(34) synthase MnmA [Desulfovibrionaceae bacterium]